MSDPEAVQDVDPSQAELRARARYAQWQAYTALVIQALAALGTIASLVISVLQGTASFWLVVGLAIFLAVSQSGVAGFISIVEGLRDAVGRSRVDKGEPS